MAHTIEGFYKISKLCFNFRVPLKAEGFNPSPLEFLVNLFFSLQKLFERLQLQKGSNKNTFCDQKYFWQTFFFSSDQRNKKNLGSVSNRSFIIHLKQCKSFFSFETNFDHGGKSCRGKKILDKDFGSRQLERQLQKV